MRKRGFEVISTYAQQKIQLPQRATHHAAGYDFEAAEDVTIPSIHLSVRQLLTFMDNEVEKMNTEEMTDEQYKEFERITNLADSLGEFEQLDEENHRALYTLLDDINDNDGLSIAEYFVEFMKGAKPTLVPTGIKAKMPSDEMLLLYNRSSNPLKRFLLLANGVGVVDSDYYNNEGNEGHIQFQFLNFGPKPITIKKGERIGQGIFQKFLLTTDCEITHSGDLRLGGFGSTNKEE